MLVDTERKLCSRYMFENFNVNSDFSYILNSCSSYIVEIEEQYSIYGFVKRLTTAVRSEGA